MTLQHIDTLFRSDSVALLGEANTVAQAQLVDNLRASVAESAVKHARARASIARLPAEGTRLAVILEVRWGTPKLIRAMGQAGYQAVFWAADGDPGEAVLRAARPFNLRVLGGRSAGVVNTRSGLNLSTLALDSPVRPGRADHPVAVAGRGRAGLGQGPQYRFFLAGLYRRRGRYRRRRYARLCRA